MGKLKGNSLIVQRVLKCLALLWLACGLNQVFAAVAVDQQPLTLSNNVAGNLVITPSVESPTILTLANQGSFNLSSSYDGYFDQNKCYTYNPSAALPTLTSAPQMASPKGQLGYFEPISVSAGGPAICFGHWSGNYLNWAATQTIDTFRSVMTGGYRAVDTTALTVLEKARNTGQVSAGYLSISDSISSVVPSNFKYFATRLNGLGNKMYFVSGDSEQYANYTLQDLLSDPKTAPSNSDPKAVEGVIPYTRQVLQPYYVYSVNIDVQVCKSGFLESNCVQYQSNYKPEGMIQKYAAGFTFSVFGYLNISDRLQDGAALRAKQKFVGPFTYDPVQGAVKNTHSEWDPDTGVFVKNPDPADAANTSNQIGAQISDSGVINFLNKFGEMTVGGTKADDPVSEMYYAAIRYLKNQGPVSSYSNMKTYGTGTPYEIADGFPIIQNWSDPMAYSCQKNFILGIGDTNTWSDKNLPGNLYKRSSEPAMPPEISADHTVDVIQALNQISLIEKAYIPTPIRADTDNSAYIAALAYDSHTRDIRPDLLGDQFVSTFWVDVEEQQQLAPMSKNQYMLAAKYGGFSVPNGFSPYTFNGPMPKAWWTTTGDKVKTINGQEDRPDNFFEGGNASSMRSGLNNGFSLISSQNVGSQSSLALNSGQLQADSTVYLASYQEGAWRGSLKAYSVDPITKTVSGVPLWDAATALPAYNQRKAFTVVDGVYKAFNANNVAGQGWTTDLVNYALGDSSKEARKGGTFRNRTTALGDIVNSQPQYVGTPNPLLFSGQSFTGSTEYISFATKGAAVTRAPTVYVAANDGMLHGFNAKTGVETYAFMPGAVLMPPAIVAATVNPSLLAQTNYGSSVNHHRYFNDGLLTVGSAYYSGAWHTVLVGSTGRGDSISIYALDVTDPNNVKFLWEKNIGSNPYVGQVLGRPVIAQTAVGWVALIGNGYNSPLGRAALLSIAIDGSSDPALNVYTAGTDSNNGLSTPVALIATPSKGFSTTAYAGDLAGNVWLFDLTRPSGTGKLVFTTPLDANGRHQPITMSLLLAKDPLTSHLWGFFGTGKYLTTTDVSDKQVETWYGLVLDESLPVSKGNLVQRSIVGESAGSAANPNARPPVPAVSAGRVFSAGNTVEMTGKSGWFMDLVSPAFGSEGERMLVGNQLVSGLLVGTTLISDLSSPCLPSGRGWVMAVDPFTGTNPISTFFDMNNDGVLSVSDQIRYQGAPVASGAIGFSSLTGSPAFVGSVMLVNLNGELQAQKLGPPVRSVQSRVSWREIINQ